MLLSDAQKPAVVWNLSHYVWLWVNMSCLMAGISAWTSCLGREGPGLLKIQRVEVFVCAVVHRERGTSSSFSTKKTMVGLFFVCWLFFGFCFLGGLWQRIILTSWVLHFPFLSKKVGSVELFWGYLCMKAMSIHWPWPTHHSRNTRRRVFAWQDKYLSTNTGATEAKTASAWSCNSSYWAADQSGNPDFRFCFT